MLAIILTTRMSYFHHAAVVSGVQQVKEHAVDVSLVLGTVLVDSQVSVAFVPVATAKREDKGGESLFGCVEDPRDKAEGEVDN